MTAPDAPMSWPKIIGILLAVAFATGLTLGILTEVIDINAGGVGGGIGGSTGITAAWLISKRRAALAAQQRQK